MGRLSRQMGKLKAILTWGDSYLLPAPQVFLLLEGSLPNALAKFIPAGVPPWVSKNQTSQSARP